MTLAPVSIWVTPTAQSKDVLGAQTPSGEVAVAPCEDLVWSIHYYMNAPCENLLSVAQVPGALPLGLSAHLMRLI